MPQLSVVSLESDVPAPCGSEPAGLIDLERAFTQLPDHQRMVLVLHDLEGFTHEEIGEQLNIAIGTSKVTLSRARQALRRLLNNGVPHGC
jgi:RNA polymerase sigma-70 factor (ECF subfamily)